MPLCGLKRKERGLEFDISDMEKEKESTMEKESSTHPPCLRKSSIIHWFASFNVSASIAFRIFPAGILSLYMVNSWKLIVNSCFF